MATVGMRRWGTVRDVVGAGAPRPAVTQTPPTGYQSEGTPGWPVPETPAPDYSLWPGHDTGREGPMLPMQGGDLFPTTMPSMSTYWNDPLLQQYTSFASDAVGRLANANGSPNGVLQDAINKLQAMYSTPMFSTGGPMDSPDALKNSDLLRTKFVEPLMQQRDASQKRALERASARGLGLTSGLTEELARGVDTQFDQQLAQGYRDLLLQEATANRANQQFATGQLANIGQGMQGEAERNLVAALNASQGLAQLPMQQMMSVASLMNSLNNQPYPQADPTTGLIQMLLQMANGGQFAQQNAQNQQGAFWQSLFQSLPGLLPGGDSYVMNDVNNVERDIYS